MVTVEVLPADRGDCLWVECARDGDRPWRMLVDGGMAACYPALRERVLQMPTAERVIDLAVVSHIDADHIGGMLALLADTALGVSFGDVWFNALAQLPEPGTDVSRSVGEGESLVALLTGAGGAAPLPWNRAFGGKAAMTADDRAVRVVDVPGGPKLTLLSPTPKRLIALRRVWTEALGTLKRGEPAHPEEPPPGREPLDDLPALAARETNPDGSIANGSSIALLLEHRGASALLAADAFASVLGAAVTTLVNERGIERLPLDLLKLSHHASKGNVSTKLLALTPARHYAVSTNGARFHHPDDVALARVVTSAPAGATLHFNYRTEATARWAEPCARHGMTAAFGERIELP